MIKFFSKFIVVFVFLSSSFLLANEEQTIIEDIFFHIYNEEFDLAKKKLDSNKKNITDFSFSFLNSDLMWWIAIKKNDKKTFRDLQKYFENTLKNKKKSKNKHLQEMIYLNYLIRLSAIQNNKTDLLIYFLRLNSFIDSFKSNTLSMEQTRLFNLYHSVFLISKSKYIPFYAINIENEIQKIQKYSKSNNLIEKTLSLYLLSKIQIDIMNKPQLAKENISELLKIFPKNTTFVKMYHSLGS